jgi:predicted P-loop ATPase
LFFIAIVMRVRYPGAKFDHTLALLGEEGLGKSSLCRVLAIRDEWLLEGHRLDASPKEIIENATGKLIADNSEMVGRSQREQASIKDGMSRRADRARKAYARRAETKLRSFVAISSSNEYEVLVSRYGNRRFWPLWLRTHIDIDGLKDAIDQLYGEAVYAQEAYLKQHGKDVVLTPEHWDYFADLQEEHRVKSPTEDRIAVLMDRIEEGHVRTADVYDALDKGSHRYAAEEVAHAMKQLGWDKIKKRMPGDATSQQYFVRGSEPEAHCFTHIEGRLIRTARENAQREGSNVVPLRASRSAKRR